MSRTFPCLDQGVMVFCKTRTMGNEGLLQGPMLCSSKGFLQEVGIILKLCGTFSCVVDSRDTDIVQSLT